MSVLDPRELEASPLADLHALASELGLEGFRRLRKQDLIRQIVTAQGGEMPEPEADVPEPELEAAAPEPAAVAGEEDSPDDDSAEELFDDADAAGDRGAAEDEEQEEREEQEEEREEDVRSGILDVLPNGSGFIRAEPYKQSREDVYVSPAQIRRCELRPGDEVAGPVRPPRRNERHPSLVRVATVNGQDADSPSERSRFDSLTAAWPSERLAGPSALADTPFGKGSRVAIGGPPGAGATYLLREAVKVLRERHSDLEVIVVLAGVRPEEAADWTDAGVEVAGGAYDGSFDEQAQVAELAVQRAKRSVEAGKDVVVVIDSLDALPPSTARRVFGAGRNATDAGSLTVVASTGTAAEPHRMATTHVTLEPREGETPRLAPGSGTLRRDLLS
jgi:transcription termination factor Rho